MDVVYVVEYSRCSSEGLDSYGIFKERSKAEDFLLEIVEKLSLTVTRDSETYTDYEGFGYAKLREYKLR